jgi:hypothetical protein
VIIGLTRRGFSRKQGFGPQTVSLDIFLTSLFKVIDDRRLASPLVPWIILILYPGALGPSEI